MHINKRYKPHLVKQIPLGVRNGDEGPKRLGGGKLKHFLNQLIHDKTW